MDEATRSAASSGEAAESASTAKLPKGTRKLVVDHQSVGNSIALTLDFGKLKNACVAVHQRALAPYTEGEKQDTLLEMLRPFQLLLSTMDAGFGGCVYGNAELEKSLRNQLSAMQEFTSVFIKDLHEKENRHYPWKD